MDPDDESTGDPWLDQFCAGSKRRQARAIAAGWGCTIFVLFLLALFALVTVAVIRPASAHEDTDQFGRTQVFDPYCCNGQDCKETQDEELSEQPDGSVRHLPTGKVFGKSSIKPSSNSRQYACIWNGQARCLYRRFGN